MNRKLNSHWRSLEFCALDIETTGLDLKNDEVISIGAVSITDGRFKKAGNFYEEVSPVRSPTFASMRVHGLRGVDLESAHPAQVVIPRLINYLDDKYIVAHASWVERAFLKDHFKANGRAFPKKVIDTAGLARFVGYANSENGHEPSLEYLARSLNLPVFTPHHALGDAMTTAAVFLALATAIERSLINKSNDQLTLKLLLQYSGTK